MMATWRDTILAEFVPDLNKLTIVYDPDHLFADETLFKMLNTKRFEITAFKDSIEFRYAFETKYRARWEHDNNFNLAVIVSTDRNSSNKLPYDILDNSRCLSFSIGDVFPNLSSTVIGLLQVEHFDRLFNSYAKYNPERLGENASKDFILRHVFEIAPELMQTDVDLLKCLLRLHYGNVQLPLVLIKRLINLLRDCQAFNEWPLLNLFSYGQYFYRFLEERWPSFLLKVLPENTLDIEKDVKPQIPFGHDDIKIYIDNLFIEGKMSPLDIELGNINLNLKDKWVLNGVRSKASNPAEKINKLFGMIKDKIPKDDSKYNEWINFSIIWGELSFLIHTTGDEEALGIYENLFREINKYFTLWMGNNYSRLFSLPALSPVMVHHLPKKIALDNNEHAALIVLDGMSMEIWSSIKQIIFDELKDYSITEAALFAWVPTLTSVSRQAIFSGKIPMFFHDSINTTNYEDKLWTQFWENDGISGNHVAYIRGLGNSESITIIEDKFNLSQTRRIGIVIDTIDKIMHGMQLGIKGMCNQSIQWVESGVLTNIIKFFADSGFKIWITSDHGHLECDGIGRPSDGVLAETKGERCRVYNSKDMQVKTNQSFPNSIVWNNIGLPEDYLPLLAGGKDAFTSAKSKTVGHGGISIEEVIVPLITISKEN